MKDRHLKNGAFLIAEKPYTGVMFDGSIVLALHGDEYVTWDKDNEGNCHSGHYFGKNNFFDAVEDFRGR